MKRKTFSILLAALLFHIYAAAQVTVSGVVSDELNDPVIGATVLLKGTTVGTVTNLDGFYSLTVPRESGILVFSYVGMATEEIAYEGSGQIDIVMKATALDLEEVVVIGYGTAKKSDLTGAVSVVKGDEVVKAPTNNPIEAIQGLVPGMLISKESGAAGSGVDILIRGNRSINGSNSPLFIIDGVQGASVSDLNATDIASINILKDASSTAIYGSQGANGVVIITTKRGLPGKMKVTYDGYTGINGLSFYPPSRTGEDYINLRREAYRAAGAWESEADDESIFETYEWEAIQNNEWVDWKDLVLHNGILHNHVLSFSGGNERTLTRFSAGYMKEGGMYKNDNMNRYNIRMSIEHNLIKWIKTGVTGQFTYYNIDRRYDPIKYALYTAPFGEPYDEYGNVITYPIATDQSVISPLADEAGPNVAVNNTKRNRIFLNGYLELTPFKGISYKSNLAVNLDNNRQGQYYDAASLRQSSSRRPESIYNAENSSYINWDNILNWGMDIGNHTVALTALTSYTRSVSEYVEASGTDQALASQLFYFLQGNDQASRITYSGYVGTATFSLAGRINYDYQDKYYLTASYRYDGASRLAPGHKWAGFPSIAAAWRISQENFMSSIEVISNLKLRLSYGVAGNSGIEPYGTQSNVYLDTEMSFGNIAAPAYKVWLVGNEELGWEKSATTNLGLDIGLLSNRVSTGIDLYNTNTTDILMERSLPPSSGVGVTYQNIGATNNKGVEVSLNSVNLHTRNFSWSSSLTFARNKEEIVSLIDTNNIYKGGNDYSLMIGYPMHSWYNWTRDGLWQLGEEEEMAKYIVHSFKPGDIKLIDLNRDYRIDNEDRTYIGSYMPKWEGGIHNTFRFYGFDLDIYIYARWGQTIFGEFLGRYNPSGEGNGPATVEYWTPENAVNEYPSPYRGKRIIDYFGYETLLFADGSYVKLKNLSLGYTIPSSLTRKLFMERFRVYATTTNLLTFVKTPILKYYDPERGGSESSPLNRQIIFGLNVSF